MLAGILLINIERGGRGDRLQVANFDALTLFSIYCLECLVSFVFSSCMSACGCPVAGLWTVHYRGQ